MRYTRKIQRVIPALDGATARIPLRLLQRSTGFGAAPISWRLFLFPFLAASLTLTALGARPTFRADPEYIIDTWEVEDGLPENSATAMAQTRDGYLWFGTFADVVRFDGAKFTRFAPQNTPALPALGVVAVHGDSFGRVWFGTYGGIAMLDGTRWRGFGQPNAPFTIPVRSFASKRNGDLLAVTFDGVVFEFSDASGCFTRLSDPPGERGQSYFAHADESNRWWVVQNKFVGYWDNGRWVAGITNIPNVARDLVACATARDGGMWLLLGRELRKYWQSVEVERRNFPYPLDGIWNASEDTHGNVWVSTIQDGLHRISPSGQARHWTATNGLSYHNARFAFEDREGNIWIGSSGGGLMRFKPRAFQTFEIADGIEERVVRSVTADAQGTVWVATYGRGLFRSNGDGWTAVRLPGHDKRLYTQSVLADSSGRVWLGTFGGGAWVLENGEFRRIPLPESMGGNILAFFEDSRRRIWISGAPGVAVYDGADGRTHFYGKEHGDWVSSVHCFGQDSTGSIWMVGQRGVVRLENEQIAPVRDGTNELHGVSFLKFDRDGVGWMFSETGGLMRWQSGHLARTQLDPGLSVFSMIEDHEGVFWMGTSQGVMRADSDELHAALNGDADRLSGRLFGVSDGLPTTELGSQRQPLVTQDAQGRLWFATQKGLAVTDPRKASSTLSPLPPVRIEEVVYRVKRLSPHKNKSLSEPDKDKEVRVVAPFTEPLRLPAGSREIDIRYTAPFFSAPELVRFETRMGNGPWYNAGATRLAHYHELNPGAETFRVRALHRTGVGSGEGTSLAFIVEPFFWQTWWFRTGTALLLVGVGAGLTWWVLREHRHALMAEARQLKAEQSAREVSGRLITAQEYERKRIARDLHDDLNQRLALLSVEMELLSGDRNHDPEASTDRIEAIATQVKELSSEVHKLSYRLHPAKLDQLGLLFAARAICQEISKQSGVKVQFEHNDVPRDLHPDLALCFYRVIQESLQNIIKHSRASNARVELQMISHQIRLVVSDNGRGFSFERASRNSGLGLVSMRERARLVGGTFTLHSKPGLGTRIELTAPVV